MADRLINPPYPAAEEPSSPKTAPDRSERLESWKEIASYLKREVRTVQRWEKGQALPVHRHRHAEGVSVFAYKDELDAWWHNCRSSLESEDKTSAESGRQRGSHWRLWVVGAMAATMGTVVGGIYVLRHGPSAPLNFQSQDLVLVAKVDNYTGESVFDGTLEAAMARELANSPFVNVVPQVRIEDTLALMRKPPNTPVDAALGREICLRDGGIRALVTGRIEKFGATYQLSANIVDPISGRLIASFEEQANGQAEILPAIRSLSNHVRRSLGEQLRQIRQSNIELAKVTTPSLKALQLYSQADKEFPLGPSEPAAFELLQQAVAEDPNFASAYNLAAYILVDEGRPSKEYMPYAKRAMELSGQASAQERYFIEASYYEFTHQNDRAIAAYEALLRVDPDNFWGLHNLAQLYAGEERNQEMIALDVRLAKLRPNSLTANLDAAIALDSWAGDAAQARPYFDRANALLSAMSASERAEVAGTVVWLQLYPAYRAWLKGDVTLASKELDRVERNPIAQDKTSVPFSFALFSVALGQAQRAKTWFQTISTKDPLDHDGGLAMLAYLRGDDSTARSSFRRVARLQETGMAIVSVMIREGLFAEAKVSIRKLRNQGGPGLQEIAELLEGQLLVAQGKTAQGMPLLIEGVARTRNQPFAIYLLGAESLAQAYEKQGNTSAALQVLQEATANPARVNWTVAIPGIPLWMRDEMALARLYRRLGRIQDAQKIEDELHKLLGVADPDFPLLVELKQLQNAPAVAHQMN